jgi:hypothetical protein
VQVMLAIFFNIRIGSFSDLSLAVQNIAPFPINLGVLH